MVKVRRFGSFPLTPIPAGIEVVGSPATVTHLLPRGSEGVVAEGTMVTAGESLCSGPVYGSFAAASGRVHRVMPWDGGSRGLFTAVCIDSERTEWRVSVCEPITEPHSADPSLLRSVCTLLGFHLPQQNVPILITMLDEDIGSVVNRWLFEKEFSRVEKGLQLLSRMFVKSSVSIAVPETLSVNRLKTLSAFGRVVPVAVRYPQVLSVLVAHSCRTDESKEVPVVIDAKHLVAIAEAVHCGCAATQMQVSLRNGRKGQTHLFQVPIGMCVGDFLEGRGITVTTGMQVVLGGEMRGFAADNLLQPLTPETDTVLVYSEKEAAVPENTPCVNCGRCCRSCPVGLRVDLLGKCTEYASDRELVRLGIEHCIDCGICAAVCMVRRPLAHLMAYGKLRAARYTAPEGTP